VSAYVSMINMQMWLDALEQSVLGPSSEVFQHHIWRCKSLMDRVRQADTVAEYSTAIKAATKEAFHVPYAWVAEQVARKQTSSYRIAFSQVLKVCAVFRTVSVWYWVRAVDYVCARESGLRTREGANKWH
jgi:hypothetical protein